MKNKIILLIIFCLIVFAVLSFTTNKKEIKEESNKNMDYTECANYKGLDKYKTYYALIKTSKGDIKVELNTKETPITAGNFICLAEKGFYNGIVFHRTIPGFMIQGGCPDGIGTGGPGYKFDDEPFDGEYNRGIIAMANAGPNTNGSQFFIMHTDYQLPKNYVIFGQVVEGINVVDMIAEAPTVQDGMENSRPVEPVAMESVEIISE